MIGEELQPAVISEKLYTFARDFGQTAGVYVEVQYTVQYSTVQWPDSRGLRGGQQGDSCYE